MSTLNELIRERNDLSDINAKLLAAAEIALEYLQNNQPKGKIGDIFHKLNEHENGVVKPLRAAIAEARGQ